MKQQANIYFLSNLTIFYPANPSFGANLSIFLAVLTNNRTEL